jgi:hypothetical protein
VLKYGVWAQLSLFCYAKNLTWVTGVGMQSPFSYFQEVGQNAITEKVVVGYLPLSLPGVTGVTAGGCLEKIPLTVTVFCLGN